MGVFNTISRSKDDTVSPKHKSYWGYDLDFYLTDVKTITEKVTHLPTEKRALMHELSGLEPVNKVLILRNAKKSLGRLTTLQVKEILDEYSFYSIRT